MYQLIICINSRSISFGILYPGKYLHFFLHSDMITECSSFCLDPSWSHKGFFKCWIFCEIILGEQQSLAKVPAGSWISGTAFFFLNNAV